MTPSTTDRDPVPPSLAAAPCRACGTTGGPKQRGDYRPYRTRGFCKRCYNRLNSQGRLDLGQGPCLSCGPRGNAVARGLCSTCYCRATGQGIVKRYPQCGAVPVPYLDLTQPAHPAPPPAGLAPILRPDPTLPVWTGLAVAKYPQTTWHTYRPEDRRLSRSAWERQLGKAA